MSVSLRLDIDGRFITSHYYSVAHRVSCKPFRPLATEVLDNRGGVHLVDAALYFISLRLGVVSASISSLIALSPRWCFVSISTCVNK